MTPRRLHVVGTSGSGKSTLARAVAERLGLVHVELDALHWLPDWKERSDEEMRALLAEALAGDAWVVDGNYGRQVRDLVWARADTIVWLDLPRLTVTSRVIRRTFRRWWRSEQLWSGNREPLGRAFSRDSIVWWAWSTHPRRRAEYTALLANEPRAARLRSPAETEAWLASLDRGPGVGSPE